MLVLVLSLSHMSAVFQGSYLHPRQMNDGEGEWLLPMSVKVVGVNQKDKRFPWCPLQKFPFKSH